VDGTAAPRKSVTWRDDGLKPTPGAARGEGELEIVFQPDATLYDGRFANNGWLQELPKPVTKLTWDNAAFVSPRTAEKYGLSLPRPGSNGGEHGQAIVDVVELTYGSAEAVKAPVWVLPGHADDCVTVNLGFGRSRAGKVGDNIGFNAYPLRHSKALSFGRGLKLRKLGETYVLACVQMHHLMEGRHPVRAGTLDDYRKDETFAQKMKSAGGGSAETQRLVPGPKPAGVPEGETDPRLIPLTLYPEEHKYDGYKWGMAIDLSACVGCSACVVACQAENNIPVVGKSEVTRAREMHWLRIDRYYRGSIDDPTSYFQPVPCMQCENAPCEVVCPVGATVHSDDGLNDMVYNRCVGTRYCSNNCPYKVRRFNFFQYADYATKSLKLLRNPEVTVRTRGVMEKCTYCVQRIRSAEITAEKEGRRIRDGEVLTACQAACPAQAIVFGDLNDPKAQVTRTKEGPRNYGLLAELNTRPRTTYLAAVRNPNAELE
jgi:Fe-S-cluster-containing dehydrogenase component